MSIDREHYNRNVTSLLEDFLLVKYELKQSKKCKIKGCGKILREKQIEIDKRD